MSEPYVTQDDLTAGLRRVGLGAGDTVIVHSSLGAFGHLIGGAHAAVKALLDVLTPAGTLVVPTHTPENSDPDEFVFPPLPPRARQLWRDHFPAFDPARTPCGDYMGVIPELARTLPGALRSQHPFMSFSAIGRHAHAVTTDHPLNDGMGERSPLGRIYALDGKILLMGVDHDANSSLHLAQARAGLDQQVARYAAMQRDGQRAWVEYQDLDWDDSLLMSIGADLERAHPFQETQVGPARLRVFSQRVAVDFATAWIRANAGAAPPPKPEPPSTLRTSELALTRAHVEDAASLWALSADAERMRSIGLAPHASVEEAEDFLCRLDHRWELATDFSWLAAQLHGGSLVGLVLAHVDEHCVTLSVALAGDDIVPAMARAVQEIITALFATIPSVARVQLLCAPTDGRQLDLAQRCGLVREGCLRNARQLPDGQVGDGVMLGLARG